MTGKLLRFLLAGLVAFTIYVGVGDAFDQYVEASGRGPVTALAGGTPRPATLTGRSASLRAIRAVFGRRAAAAIRVAGCETGWTWNERSVGSQGELSIFQIHPVHFWHRVRSKVGSIYVDPRRLRDSVFASRVAFVMSRGGTDWRAWTCRP